MIHPFPKSGVGKFDSLFFLNGGCQEHIVSWRRAKIRFIG
jgi:hypothetical protein